MPAERQRVRILHDAPPIGFVAQKVHDLRAQFVHIAEHGHMLSILEEPIVHPPFPGDRPVGSVAQQQRRARCHDLEIARAYKMLRASRAHPHLRARHPPGVLVVVACLPRTIVRAIQIRLAPCAGVQPD
eukprot:1287678-Prymnesium_polylepis.1